MEKYPREIDINATEDVVLKSFEKGDKIGEMLQSFHDFRDEFTAFREENINNTQVLFEFSKFRDDFFKKYDKLFDLMGALIMASNIEKEPISEGGFDQVVISMNEVTDIINEIQPRMDKVKRELAAEKKKVA